MLSALGWAAKASAKKARYRSPWAWGSPGNAVTRLRIRGPPALIGAMRKLLRRRLPVPVSAPDRVPPANRPCPGIAGPCRWLVPPCRQGRQMRYGTDGYRALSGARVDQLYEKD